MQQWEKNLNDSLNKSIENGIRTLSKEIKNLFAKELKLFFFLLLSVSLL